MLRVRTEYSKGILFVRLIGRIDNEGYIEKINDLIEDVGIKLTVLNITYLQELSLNNINILKKYIQKLNKKKHLLLICDEKELKNQALTKIPRIKNEIEAFSLINRKDAYE